MTISKKKSNQKEKTEIVWAYKPRNSFVASRTQKRMQCLVLVDCYGDRNYVHEECCLSGDDGISAGYKFPRLLKSF